MIPDPISDDRVKDSRRTSDRNFVVLASFSDVIRILSYTWMFQSFLEFNLLCQDDPSIILISRLQKEHCSYTWSIRAEDFHTCHEEGIPRAAVHARPPG